MLDASPLMTSVDGQEFTFIGSSMFVQSSLAEEPAMPHIETVFGIA